MAVAQLPERTHGREEVHRPSMNQLGLWLFFLSESYLFAAFLVARFYIAGLDRPADQNQALGLGITLVLIVSGFTASRALAAMAYGDRAAFQRFIFVTIVLGLIFVGGVAVEWSTAKFSISEPYGTAFFSMTGLHTAHVISGLGMLGLAYWLSLRGHFSGERHWGVEATIKYWQFVDVVWVFFYPALYLVG